VIAIIYLSRDLLSHRVGHLAFPGFSSVLLVLLPHDMKATRVAAASLSLLVGGAPCLVQGSNTVDFAVKVLSLPRQVMKQGMVKIFGMNPEKADKLFTPDTGNLEPIPYASEYAVREAGVDVVLYRARHATR
jgi:hypothetical protein